MSDEEESRAEQVLPREGKRRSGVLGLSNGDGLSLDWEQVRLMNHELQQVAADDLELFQIAFFKRGHTSEKAKV